MPLPSFVKVIGGWPTIDGGSMIHQLTVLQQAIASPPSYDASGVSTSWTPLYTQVAAAIGSQAAAGNVRAGIDVIHGDQIVSQLYVAIAIWYVAAPGLTPNMRVTTENGSTYIIQSIENVLERNVVLVLTCLGLGANT